MSDIRRNWLILALLTAISLPIFVFYVWLFIDSVSVVKPGQLWPDEWSLRNWSFLLVSPFERDSVWRATANSLIFAGSVVAIVLTLSSTAGYALSRLNFPFRRQFLAGVLILHAFPSVTLLIALFLMLRAIGLYDTLLGVILVKASLELPLGIWIMKGFYDTVPWEIEMAGLQDGASRFQVWYKLVLPQVKPALAALAIFSFVAGWAEFVLPFVLAPSAHVRTLPVFLAGLLSDSMLVDFGMFKAVGLFYMAPVILFYVLAQDKMMNIYGGGSKG